jgi:hypothetical protein
LSDYQFLSTDCASSEKERHVRHTSVRAATT